MREFIRKPLVLKIFSLILAITIWLYVINMENPETSYDLNNIAVKIETGNTTPYKNDLIIVSDMNQSVSIKIGGRHNALSSYNFDSVSASVDINSITAEGEYMLPVNVDIGSGGDVWLISYSPMEISLKFSLTVTKSVPIVAQIQGSLDDDFVTGEVRARPEFVDITGPAQEVDEVSHALVLIKADSVVDGRPVEADIILIDKSNQEVKSKFITLKTAKASVDVSVLKKKTVSLFVKTQGAYAIDSKRVVLDIEPKSIDISGTFDVIDALDAIVVGTIDLGAVEDGQQYNFDLTMPAGVNNLSQISQATVTARIVEGENRTIFGVDVDTTLLAGIDLGGYSVDVLNKQIDVTVFGIENDILNILAADISARASFSTLTLTPSVQQIRVDVWLNKDFNASVVGSYSINVEVKGP